MPNFVPNSARCRIVGRENLRHACHRVIALIFTNSKKSITSHALTSQTEFGKAGALYQDMMPQLIETFEQAPRACCSREQARALLEGLRAAYQSLSLADRSSAKSVIGRAQREQSMQEIREEKECFESVS
ncbi:MAG: hypothetical protein DMG90_03890 [Acidobacteria bacterium]|nr:MAG: hypothetical protein DMG90_03890 [Acidobacteriota bacterium]